MNSDALGTGAFSAASAKARFGARTLFGFAAAAVFFTLGFALLLAIGFALGFVRGFVPCFAPFLVLFFVLIVRTPLPGRMDVSCLCRSAAGKACARLYTTRRR